MSAKCGKKWSAEIHIKYLYEATSIDKRQIKNNSSNPLDFSIDYTKKYNLIVKTEGISEFLKLVYAHQSRPKKAAKNLMHPPPSIWGP